MKYIITDDTLSKKSYLFDESINHVNFANFISPTRKPISAGFVKWHKDGVICYGDSFSLALAPHKEDEDIIERALNMDKDI